MVTSNMVTSKRIHNGLVDVFYGNNGFSSKEWVRCTFSPTRGWKIVKGPTKFHQDEIDFGNVVDKDFITMNIFNHLTETYGKRGNK